MENTQLQIVIVDDESQITDLLKTFLLCISTEIAIHLFNDAGEAKEFLERNTIDVLITDYKMPKFDGIQLMKVTTPEAMKILISGYVSEITENQLHALKASFFEKPVPMKNLGKIIHEAQERKKACASNA